MSKTTFSTSEIKRIDAIIRSTIGDVFFKKNFPYDRDDVEEVASEAFVRVLAHKDDYDATISGSSWFATIARNCAYTYMSERTKWYQVHTPMTMKIYDDEFGEQDTPEIDYADSCHTDSALITSECMAILDRALCGLGDKASRALMMQSQGCPMSEIQDSLAMKPGALRTMMSRGRDKLVQDKFVRTLYAEVYGHDYKKSA